MKIKSMLFGCITAGTLALSNQVSASIGSNTMVITCVDRSEFIELWSVTAYTPREQNYFLSRCFNEGGFPDIKLI
ncbi:hypothetical protein [Pseudoalteromonas luteoviolacea]|uniref:Uncharacterized protein n=1 Tax=Pseudoalteromonas luteoviolacea H33 TaxID=1365251 RepID=A0A167DNF5_9GAMM|nr:hypothetical protein [Pseudoalteromonas luteoviolacea]KZN49093.1 hypothetical protein N476_20500 [Pseudoalteromonas luteoviolacea H33]KZN75500.1 hypothetical protein N477_18810 [Pseudoalteromonas luteoviolacea H33-S]